ncbi:MULTISPECIES: sn-glycerol-1-phosphate dehydrogenase [unclassified Schaalia]|uniref:sn-glycerol-1-phosphate dehydrogenase n=1 Tax=unclassified Schaalia TaxID=2691889 RepID=UPI001E391DC2|nr:MULTISPECIES: sn-glycerol-1-phosphate dehydrogenase [unclassified Schaalia]MCD4549027.1 sn-glycerol-1-phosphate dehydrogenase [Schaalia sp. lx-260]MCD4557215.1 sn-glycerol-1-phosphate dehydrogenase [Schaalia sp. lx-100]
MSSELIEKALTTATETRDIIFGDNVTKQTGTLFAKLFPGAQVLLVADGNTFAATGEAVIQSLQAANVEFADEPYIFPGTPTLYAGYENVEILREYIRPFEKAIVCSIGSGSLNDIAKLASGELGREYMNVCTAPSVDGFAAFGASIARDGFKITRSCPAPAGLIADTEVVCNSPQRLIATGYGDLIEKIPAGADWILADALGIEAINEYVWNMVQGPLRDSLADPEAIAQGDKKSIENLMEGNLMSGLAMQAGQSSRSASGAGHQFSHTWEMEGHGLDWEPPLSHGFKVGIGTIASCAIWEEFLAMEADDFDIEHALASVKTPEEIETQVRSLLQPRMQDEALRHSLTKRIEGEELVDRINLLKEKWPELRERCKAQLMSPSDVMARLKAVGAPYHPELIKIDWDRFRETHIKAQMIRDRYTVFDILVDLGIYDKIIEHLFSKDGFWGQHRHPEA